MEALLLAVRPRIPGVWYSLGRIRFVGTVLAGLLSAFSYGLGDFLSGLVSRHDPPLRLLALTHPLSAVLLLGLAALLGQPLPPVADLAWGGVAGAVALVALVLFFRGLALGPMGPVAVGAGALSALIPVVAGLLVGEQLSWWGWLGSLAVLAGIGLLGWVPGHPQAARQRTGLWLGLLAGLGFGLYFVLLAQAQSQEGRLWTLGVARVCSSLLVVPAVLVLRVGLRPRQFRLMLLAMPFDVLGNLFFLMAAQGGSLALSGLLTSLYPAVTTLLAVFILRETLRWGQWSGMALGLLGAAALALS